MQQAPFRKCKHFFAKSAKLNAGTDDVSTCIKLKYHGTGISMSDSQGYVWRGVRGLGHSMQPQRYPPSADLPDSELGEAGMG